MTTTEDAILDGRLRLRQPKRGHRFGHDAILLAAAVSCKAQARVVELGGGVGAAALALLARMPGLSLTLIERDPVLTALAQSNIDANGFGRQARAVSLDVGAPARSFAGAGLAAGTIDVVLMNPPFNAAKGHPSPDPLRKAAHEADHDTLIVWVKAATRLLRAGGLLAVIWRSDGLDEVLAALAPAYGGITVYPIYPDDDKPAIRVIVTAMKGSRAPLSIAPALVLAASGRPTDQADAILRKGAALADVLRQSTFNPHGGGVWARDRRKP